MKALKRQLTASSDDANERAQQAETERSAADWERKRALERVASLEVAKNRELERAQSAEAVASEKENELILLRREAMAASEQHEASLHELKSKLTRTIEDLAKERSDKLKAKEDFDNLFRESKMKVEEVKNEVARKVPELAAGALKRAEEEWRRRAGEEAERCRKERDAYISEAKLSVSELERSLGKFKRDRETSSSLIEELKSENEELVRANDNLRSEVELSTSTSRAKAESSRRFKDPDDSSSYDLNNHSHYPHHHHHLHQQQQQQQQQQRSSQMFTPLPHPAHLYSNLNEVAANATLTTLQAHLSIMQTQCRQLLNDSKSTKSSTPLATLGLSQMNVTAEAENSEDIERLFASPPPKKSGGGRKQHRPETLDDDLLFSKSEADQADISVEPANVSRSTIMDESLNRSGYLGNLWKSRYGKRSAAEMPR